MIENSCENDNDDDDYEDDSEILDEEDELKNYEFEEDFVVEVKMEDENKKQKLLDKYKKLLGKKC